MEGMCSVQEGHLKVDLMLKCSLLAILASFLVWMKEKMYSWWWFLSKFKGQLGTSSKEMYDEFVKELTWQNCTSVAVA